MQTSVTFQSSRWAFTVHHEDFLFVISQVVITFKVSYVIHAVSELTDSS